MKVIIVILIIVIVIVNKIRQNKQINCFFLLCILIMDLLRTNIKQNLRQLYDVPFQTTTIKEMRLNIRILLTLCKRLFWNR
jgi:hypothetical protein